LRWWWKNEKLKVQNAKLKSARVSPGPEFKPAYSTSMKPGCPCPSVAGGRRDHVSPHARSFWGLGATRKECCLQHVRAAACGRMNAAHDECSLDRSSLRHTLPFDVSIRRAKILFLPYMLNASADSPPARARVVGPTRR